VNIGLSSGVIVLIVCWQERGMPVPHPNIHGPSAYIPVEEVRAIGHPFVICYEYFSSQLLAVLVLRRVFCRKLIKVNYILGVTHDSSDLWTCLPIMSNTVY